MVYQKKKYEGAILLF
ncbi:MAG: hypothetical protein IJ445_03645 [Clostridia bacterium]|nr:hypothetical protein [Clostridia bacterium]